MANAKREHDYDIAIATIGYLGCSFNGDVNGANRNPYHNVDRIKSEAEVKEESSSAWAMLNKGLSHIANGRG